MRKRGGRQVEVQAERGGEYQLPTFFSTVIYQIKLQPQLFILLILATSIKTNYIYQQNPPLKIHFLIS